MYFHVHLHFQFLPDPEVPKYFLNGDEIDVRWNDVFHSYVGGYGCGSLHDTDSV